MFPFRKKISNKLWINSSRHDASESNPPALLCPWMPKKTLFGQVSLRHHCNCIIWWIVQTRVTLPGKYSILLIGKCALKLTCVKSTFLNNMVSLVKVFQVENIWLWFLSTTTLVRPSICTSRFIVNAEFLPLCRCPCESAHHTTISIKSEPASIKPFSYHNHQ